MGVSFLSRGSPISPPRLPLRLLCSHHHSAPSFPCLLALQLATASETEFWDDFTCLYQRLHCCCSKWVTRSLVLLCFREMGNKWALSLLRRHLIRVWIMSMYNSAQNVTVLGQVATFLWQVTMGSSWGNVCRCRGAGRSEWTERSTGLFLDLFKRLCLGNC